MIKINGKVIRNIPEQVGKNKRDIFQLDTDLTALEVKVNEALAGVFHYKGSVATYADLPASDNEVGDVYNVIDTGKNYAWDGSAWDDLGGLIDLSNYVTLNGDQTISGIKTFTDNVKIIDPTLTYTYSALAISNGNLYFRRGTTDLAIFNTNSTTLRELRPLSNTNSIGNSTYLWKDLYLSGSLKDGTYSVSIEDIVDLSSAQTITGEKTFKNKIYILDNNNTHYWNLVSDENGNLYVYRGSTYAAIFGTSVSIFREIRPSSDNAWDCGATNRRWKDVYIGNNLTNGTDTATVADIAALIAYAKAQGWIS